MIVRGTGRLRKLKLHDMGERPERPLANRNAKGGLPMKSLRRTLLAFTLTLGLAACGSSITEPYTPDSGNYTPDSGNYTPDSGNYTPDSGN